MKDYMDIFHLVVCFSTITALAFYAARDFAAGNLKDGLTLLSLAEILRLAAKAAV